MELHGKNLIGSLSSALGSGVIHPYDPKSGQPLPPSFSEATTDEIGAAAELAASAFDQYRNFPPERVAAFLEQIAVNILDLGDELVDRASQESGLPKERLIGERARTVGQLRMFAALILEGSWVDARLDTALPDRKPLPRPDLRRMLIPIGPVAVYGASNFPLAFSVAGGDTASALAARNPVIVKAHPAHPGTSELVGHAIVEAVKTSGVPDGTFSLIHGALPETSLALIRHHAIKAGSFTGSLRAGRALFDAASQRPEPIPFYAEMGSVNPVFVLPGALRERGEALALGLKNSVVLGVGQFCTCPGLVIGKEDDHLRGLIENMRRLFEQESPGTMLYPGILRAYLNGVEDRAKLPEVHVTQSKQPIDPTRTEAGASLFEVDAKQFLQCESLQQELFGPSTTVVKCSTPEDLASIAAHLEGSLTATLHGTEEDFLAHRELISVLEQKAGRVIFNGYPTGVEVSPAMNHGGPYPATADPKFTSVGTAAIYRFARPICYQGAPQAVLPPELQDGNPRKIWRTVNNSLSKE
jgi:NADP-dependent aldehyde dehydrogenase